MAAHTLECPKCRLINPASAVRCDCGFDFRTKTVEPSYLATNSAHDAYGTAFGGFLAGALAGMIGLLIVYLVTEAKATRKGAWWGLGVRALVVILFFIGR